MDFAITKAPVLASRQNDPGEYSCVPWFAIESACVSSIPHYLSLPFSVEASCACYSRSVWQPGVYDGYFDTCVSHLSTASPAEFTALGGTRIAKSPCQDVGNVAKATKTYTGIGSVKKQAPVTSYDPNALACTSFGSVQVSCSDYTSSFSALAFSQQASCLCYVQNQYKPTVYDGYIASCLDYYKTAAPQLYSSFGPDGGENENRNQCQSVGNVRGNVITSPTTESLTPTPGPVSTTAAPTTRVAGQAQGANMVTFKTLVTALGIAAYILL